jgi:uncharacterized iron-regulated membrane protein
MTAASLDSSLVVAQQRLYRTIWRWHFYAGLVVVPFMLVLAVTGLIMVYGNTVATKLGPRFDIAPGSNTTLVEQGDIAKSAVPGSAVKIAILRDSPAKPVVFVVEADETQHLVSIDPVTKAPLSVMLRSNTWYAWASNIHGSLLIGDTGDWILEIAAGLGIVLTITGLFLWWPRDSGLATVLVPRLWLTGRAFWKELHVSVGFYISIVLLFFLLSGLAWTGVWGSKFVQAWSAFPAEKWDNVPLSDEKHAKMNHANLKEVPWPLEQTAMPESGSTSGITGLPDGTKVNLDSVAYLGRQIGFDGQFRINLPGDEKGVYTISADTMDADTTSPTGDRTVHVDQYTGKILGDVKFSDYSVAGKAMAVGIALHQSDMGWWNVALNTLFCLAIIFMSVSGVVMWWKRRPAGSLGAPLYPADYRIPRGILIISAAVAAAFPLTGIGILVFAIIDFLLPKHLKEMSVAE